MVDKQRNEAPNQKANKLPGRDRDSADATLEIVRHVRDDQQQQQQQHQEEPEMAPQEAINLLHRIRSDRLDVEQRLVRVKDYISRTTDAMAKVKDRPEMAEKYRRLTTARAELVTNAVSLRQLQERLSSSETRAMEIIADNNIAVNEDEPGRLVELPSGVDHTSTTTDVPNNSWQPPESEDRPATTVFEEPSVQPESSDGAGSLGSEERTHLAKRSQLIQKIVETEQRTQELEVKRRDLDRIRNNLEVRIKDAQTARINLQLQAGVARHSEAVSQSNEEHPSAIQVDATSSSETSTSAELPVDRSTETQPEQQDQLLSSLHTRLASLHTIPSDSMDDESAAQLRGRLQQLDTFRSQMNTIIQQIEELKKLRAATRPATPGESEEPRQNSSDSGTTLIDSEKESREMAAGSGMNCFEQINPIVSTDHDKTVMNKETTQMTKAPLPKTSGAGKLPESYRTLEADKIHLEQLKELSKQLEEKQKLGEKLSQTAPGQLAQLIAASQEISPNSDRSQIREEAALVVLNLQQAQRTIDTVADFTKQT